MDAKMTRLGIPHGERKAGHIGPDEPAKNYFQLRKYDADADQR